MGDGLKFGGVETLLKVRECKPGGVGFGKDKTGGSHCQIRSTKKSSLNVVDRFILFSD
jgi:hypothetical protein